MVVEAKNFKEACSSILAAIDNSELSNYSEALELVTKDSCLFLNVTNKEYYVSIKFSLEEEADIHAVINAHTFLNLIKNITTEEIKLEVKDNYLLVKANGNYKFPLIYENGSLMKLPKISINNKTLEMNVGGDILNSIIKYNSKILSKQDTTPVQKLYYLDQEGCITFSSCTCVNNFTLEKPLNILINNKLVRLFKLFKDDLVTFSLGYDSLDSGITQTKVNLETNTISLTSILPGESLLPRYPTAQLRSLANRIYPYTAVLKVEEFLGALNRLSLFNKKIDDCYFECNADEVTIKMGENEEVMPTANGSNIEEPYSMVLKLNHIKNILENCEEPYITFNFGNKNSATLVRGNVVNVLPEVMING